MTLTPNQKKAGIAVTAVAVGLTVLLIATRKKKDVGGTTNDPTGNGAINTPTFNAATVSLRLLDAMKETGTDEEAVFEILTSVNQPQFGQVVAAFGKRQYNKLTGNQYSYVPFYTLNYYNLREWLENELSDENYFTLRKNILITCNMKNPYFSAYSHLGSSVTPMFDVLPGEFDDLNFSPRPLVIPVTTVPASGIASQNTPNNLTLPAANSATTTMTLRTTIVDNVGVVPANVTIDGKTYANTATGLIQLTGVNANSIVTISSLGYKTYSSKASEVPEKVVLAEESNILPEAVIPPKPKPKPVPKEKSNLGWWLLGAAVVTGIYYNSKKTAKTKGKLANPIPVKATL